MPAIGKGRVLLALNGFDVPEWRRLLSARRDVVLEPEVPNDPSIRFAVAWKQPPGLLATLPNLQVIFSAGAGVDHLFNDPDLPDVPIVRVVAENLAQHMTEYVVWRVLDHHRQSTLYRSQQAGRVWDEAAQPAANEVSVGVMGFGQLGRAAARALVGLGFRVNGWSRRKQTMDGVSSFHGESGLTPFLNASDILVVLLPLTPATEGIISYDLLGKLRRDNRLGGAVLINAGRGRLQRDADILRALEAGLLKEASLDVFETEPLPEASPLWSHPRVFVTPHAAAPSNAAHLVEQMLDQMDAFERGEPLRNLVNREAGY